MRMTVVLVAMLGAAGAARADDMSFSYELGLIVGSAAICGYALSDAKVLAYVEANVPGSNLRFASDFQMHTGYHRMQAEELGELERKVHCDAARRSAEYLGLLAP